MKESAITRSARGQACTLKLDDCLNDNGATTVFAHKNGGAMGDKVRDDQGRDVGAYLCRYCHDVVDGRIGHPYWKPYFIEEMFDFAIRRTDRILKKKRFEMNIALWRLFIMSETLQRILKRDKPKAEIVENMTRSFFKQSDSEEAVITIKPNKMTRTQAQNRLYWSIIEQIRKETFNSRSAIHDHCRDEFLDKSTEIVCNKERTVLKSTTELNTKEMGEYIDDVIVFAETDLGIKLQLPDDWRELINYTSVVNIN